MRIRLKVRRRGDGAVIVLPEDVLAKLGVGIGDTLAVTTLPRRIRLTAPEREG